MSRKLVLVVLLTLAAQVQAGAQTLPRGVQKVTATQGITEYSLPNGLHVLLIPDSSKPKVAVTITYMVGSRVEGYGETGMAHLLEHLMFKQTKTRTDIKKELSDHGAQFNGTTSWDTTNYFETVTATDENLKWAIELEADRMINARIEKLMLDPEMTVVRNEFEMGENNPNRILFQRTLEAAYTFHNYGKLTIGARSDIEHVSFTRLAAFYHNYYQPDNAVLSVAGKFDESMALKLVATAFGAVPKPTRVLERTYTEEPTQDGERDVTLRRVGDTQAILMVYHIPAATSPDMPALDLLADVLGDEPSGRLYKALVDTKKAVFVAAQAQSMHDPGWAVFTIGLRKDQSLQEARAILIKTVEGLADNPPTKEEVERVKSRMLKTYDLAMTDSEQVGQFVSGYVGFGDWRVLYWELDGVKNVTPEDIQRVAKAYLKSSNRTVGMFIPTAQPDRAEIPPSPEPAELLKNFKGPEAVSAGEVFDTSPANIEKRVTRFTLPSGLHVVLLPKQTRGGTVYAHMTLRYGDEKTLFGKGAASRLAGGTLIRGTKNRTQQQIQDEMDRLHAEIGVNGGTTAAQMGIQTTEANFAGALRLAAEVLREPSFPESEFEQTRQQMIAGLESNRSDPQALGQMELQRRLRPYPRGDIRYIPTVDEQIADVKHATIDEARQFYAQFYGASNGELVITGQFDKTAVRKLVEELFGNWKSPSPYEQVKDTYQKSEPLNKTIDTPDKQNALIIAGVTLQMNDEDPDYPALEVANYIYGGSVGSRLFSRIRDKEGLSYGVGSNLSTPTKEDAGAFIEFAICAPQNTPKAEASLKDELARTLKNGFSADEVAAGKKAWLQERQVERSGDHTLASELGQREFYGRTMKFDEALEAKVAALTAQQVSDAFRKHVDPAAMSYIKAGDFKKAGVYQGSN
jgi:zinc protease